MIPHTWVGSAENLLTPASKTTIIIMAILSVENVYMISGHQNRSLVSPLNTFIVDVWF